MTLTCRVFGAPKPKIIWKYSGATEEVLTGERFVQQSTGDLLIKVSSFLSLLRDILYCMIFVKLSLSALVSLVISN